VAQGTHREEGRARSETARFLIRRARQEWGRGLVVSFVLPVSGGSLGASEDVGCGNVAVTNSGAGAWSAVGGSGSIFSDLTATPPSTDG
jgi:hypothetical protein